jgi:hypothetical protein
MMTTLVTLIQTAERDRTATQRSATGRVVPHHHRLRAAGRALVGRLALRGFRSRARVSSVSVPGVDFRRGRSSTV